MHIFRPIRFMAVLLAVAIVTGCGGMKGPAVEVSPMAGRNVLAVEASSFDFKPAAIRMNGPGLLILEVRNTSGMEHNIAVKDPGGNLIVSRDLPENETVKVELNLPAAGKYEFYCDKPLHPSLGMKGFIEVLAK